jgi:hypothetical protein
VERDAAPLFALLRQKYSISLARDSSFAQVRVFAWTLSRLLLLSQRLFSLRCSPVCSLDLQSVRLMAILSAILVHTAPHPCAPSDICRVLALVSRCSIWTRSARSTSKLRCRRGCSTSSRRCEVWQIAAIVRHSLRLANSTTSQLQRRSRLLWPLATVKRLARSNRLQHPNQPEFEAHRTATADSKLC